MDAAPGASRDGSRRFREQTRTASDREPATAGEANPRAIQCAHDHPRARRPRHLRRRRFRRRRRAAQGRGLRRARAVHAQLGRGRGRLLHGRRRPAGRAPGLRRARRSRCTPSTSPPSTASASSSTSSTSSRAGRTPNPDVACNREIKFGVCFEHARAPRRRLVRDRPLRAHRDSRTARACCAAPTAARTRPISCTRCRARCSRARCFPIGDLPKAEVRRIAHERALPVHDKRDSTGICFIGERPFAEFLAHYLPAQPGAIETPDGPPARHAPRPDVLHAGPAPGPRGRRRARRGRERPGTSRPRTSRATCSSSCRSTITRCCCAASSTPNRRTGSPARPPAERFRCTVKTRYRQADQACDGRRSLPDGALPRAHRRRRSAP